MGIRPTKEQFNRQLEQMAGTLRNEMIEGRYALGEYLPTERTLMERFRMSNNAVRTALETLVREGWIEKVPRIGNRVAAGRPPVKLVLARNVVAQRNLELSGLLDNFHRQFPWISVETHGIDGQGNTGDADLVLADNYQFQRMVEDGAIKKLEPLTGREDMYPGLARQFAVEGSLYMRPVVFSPIVLCYNKAHFRECGLMEPDGSWTWDNLLGCAEKLSDGKGRYGFSFHAQDTNRWPLFLLQSGERFEWNAGQLNDLRGTRLLESMKVYKRIIHNRKAFPLFLSESNGDILQMFEEGKLSMILNTYMGLNLWKHANLEYDVAPVPFIYEPRTLVIVLGIGISAKSAHKEEARLLADYFVSAGAQNYIYEHTLSIPSTQLPTYSPAASTSVGINRPERYALFREMMFSYRTHSDLGIPVMSLPKIFQQLKAYLADMIDENELCDRIRGALSGETRAGASEAGD
ncbi:extracellular solute-binding protein [Paenibacillus hemerocallicola]|uniref:Extracellular solute-binding protein n=1 Tax=Paenibacillus hemerocallicola TaxID=1172614 RepID=A0A5C4SZ79_9BACL|nr:extracellular solute-binding protein [Paenibacillus hemerocallicola]TNJ60298.1 extracellular solute-binding protein [Paenibacillus hemerocallicola]